MTNYDGIDVDRWLRRNTVDMEFQRHWLNPLLNAVCRVTRWNYYWKSDSRRRLVLIDDRRGWRRVL